MCVRELRIPGGPEGPLLRTRPGPSGTAELPESGAPDPRVEEVGEERTAGRKHISSQSLFLTPRSSAPDFSLPRDRLQRPPPPSHAPHQNLSFLQDPYPDPGSIIYPLPNRIQSRSLYFTAVPPLTPSQYPFPPKAASRSNQPFSLGFLHRTQAGLSKSCRGAFRSPVSMPVTPFLALHPAPHCCSQPSSPSPAAADPPPVLFKVFPQLTSFC